MKVFLFVFALALAGWALVLVSQIATATPIPAPSEDDRPFEFWIQPASRFGVACAIAVIPGSAITAPVMKMQCFPWYPSDRKPRPRKRKEIEL
jgi:hypothetical protein